MHAARAAHLLLLGEALHLARLRALALQQLLLLPVQRQPHLRACTYAAYEMMVVHSSLLHKQNKEKQQLLLLPAQRQPHLPLPLLFLNGKRFLQLVALLRGGGKAGPAQEVSQRTVAACVMRGGHRARGSTGGSVDISAGCVAITKATWRHFEH